MEIKELVVRIVKALVEYPDEVVVSEVKSETTSVIELRVNTGDIGKVIGKQGRTAKAIRNILGSVSAKLNRRFILEILE